VRKDSLVGRQENRATAGIIDEDRNEYIRLRLVVIEAERQRMLHHRSLGTYSSEVIDNAQRLLDLEEARLQQLADQDD
jgi:CPA1 family monovalent cation:H+ antiporter